MSNQSQLAELVRSRVSEVPVPAPDLDAVRAGGRRIRRRRTTGIVAAAAVVVVAAYAGLTLPGDETSPDRGFEPIGQLDYSEGLRAYADPGRTISLGGRSFPVDDLGDLDTQASATPYGVVFFDSDQRVHLLREDGTAKVLAPAPDSPLRDGRPTSKFDATQPLVAWTELTQDGATVRVYDFEAQEEVRAIDIPCAGDSCNDVAVDAIDQGMVFIRTPDGTMLWGPRADGSLTEIAGPATRIVDAHNKVLLYDGPAPFTSFDPVWTLVKGAIDAQLSFDGQHVLYWSNTLEPTQRGGKPITLRAKGAGFWTFDTDGSVLAATYGGSGPDLEAAKSTFYDCEIPSGECTEIGQLSMPGGDPMFMGNDM